jgi:hypothetical protein
MRHFNLCFGFFSLVVSFSAAAADTNQNDYAVSFGVGLGSGFSVKKALSESTWIFANVGIGFSEITSQSTLVSNDATSRSYSMAAGVRQYLVNDKLSKFIQLTFGETITKYSSGGYSSSLRSYGATAGYGLEYFLDPQLSIEGTVGLSYSYVPSDSPTQNYSRRDISFPLAGTAINYYW